MWETTLCVCLRDTSSRSFTILTLTVQSLPVLLNKRRTLLLLGRYRIHVFVQDRTYTVVGSIKTTSLEMWIWLCFNISNQRTNMNEWTLNSRFPCTWIVTVPSQELNFKRHMSWNRLCSVRLAKMRVHCLFCW